MQFLASRSGGLPASRIASELGIHERTIYRDLQGLAASGFPLTEESRNGTTFHRWVGPSLSQAVSLMPREWLAISVATADLEERGLSEIAAHLRELVARVSRTPGKLPLLAGKARRVVRRPRVRKGAASGFEVELLAAVAEQQEVELLYRGVKDRKAEARVLQPWTLFEEGNERYVVAAAPGQDEPRMFKVARVVALKRTGRRFRIPETFVLEEWLPDGMGLMRGTGKVSLSLCFSAPVAALLREQPWPKGAQVRETDNGPLTVRVEVVVTDELIRWLMRWVPDVRVLEPESVRAELRRRLEAGVGGMGLEPGEMGGAAGIRCDPG